MMARKTKSESARTRERILDAAELEMEAHGVNQTSLARIAQRAGLTRGAIYWHFADKSALLEAMIARTHMPLRDLRQSLSAHIPGAAPLRLLREMLLHAVHRLASDEQHRRVCHIVLHRCEITGAGHPAATVMNALFADTRLALCALCTEIAALDQLRSGLTPDDAADMLVAFIAGLYECALRHPEEYAIAHHCEFKIDALLHGLFDRS
jgi:AcrR family transcriptional regulator